MKKIYHLSTCSTCKRILADLKPASDVQIREIKEQRLTEKEVDELAEIAGSYEAIFSKVAMKYRALGLDKMKLTEADFKRYILEEYTFLRRPVVVVDRHIFIGSAKKTIEEAKSYLRGR